MKILKIIDGYVTNSSSSSCPVVLAVRKGKNIRDLLIEYGIPKKIAMRHFHLDDKADDRYRLEVDDMKEEYDFYSDYVCMADWGEGDLWEELYPDIDDWDEVVEVHGDEMIEREDELSEMVDLFEEGQRGREKLVRDDLILLYVGESTGY